MDVIHGPLSESEFVRTKLGRPYPLPETEVLAMVSREGARGACHELIAVKATGAQWKQSVTETFAEGGFSEGAMNVVVRRSVAPVFSTKDEWSLQDLQRMMRRWSDDEELSEDTLCEARQLLNAAARHLQRQREREKESR